MKCFSLAMLAAMSIATLSAQATWQAGQGLSNDHAVGTNERDVTFVARDASSGYGYRQYQLPIGLTVLPWTAPNFESSVYGMRFNLGWGRYERTYGLDGGLASCSGEFGGIAANFTANVVSRFAAGLQFAPVNCVDGDVYGVQVGAVNFASRLHGVQIGFLNFNAEGIVFPLINIGF